MYKEELKVRIVVGLRSKIDILAVQQSDSFTALDEDTKRIIQSLVNIDNRVQQDFDEQTTTLTTLHARTETTIKVHAGQTITEFSNLSRQAHRQLEQILDSQTITRGAVQLSIDRNLEEHNRTREEMRCLKEEAGRQVQVLTEEIRELKVGLEESMKTIMKASKKEPKTPKEINNANFNLWVAKELMLEKLKAGTSYRMSFHVHMVPAIRHNCVTSYVATTRLEL